MKTEILTVDEALLAAKELPWALVRSLSQVTVGPAREILSELDKPDEPDRQKKLVELLEARFFGGSEMAEEIRVYRYDGTRHAVRLTQEAADAVLEETYPLGRFGGTVTVRHILKDDRSGDGDGQLCRAVTLLAGRKEAED